MIVCLRGLTLETEKALTSTKAEVYHSHQGLCLSFFYVSVCPSSTLSLSLPLPAVVFHRKRNHIIKIPSCTFLIFGSYPVDQAIVGENVAVLIYFLHRGKKRDGQDKSTALIRAAEVIWIRGSILLFQKKDETLGCPADLFQEWGLRNSVVSTEAVRSA